LLLALLLSIEAPAPSLAVDCLTVERLAGAMALPMPGVGIDLELEVELSDQDRCSWETRSDRETPALFLALPDPLKWPIFVELETPLAADSVLAANVAMLDGAGAVLRLAPWSSFRERRGHQILRLIIRPEDAAGYLWIGAAARPWPIVGRRTFRPASTRTLSVLGLETGDDVTRYVASRADGEITIRIKRFAPPALP
jgi:hypothetical protein